jgi:proteasome lid subunit RPN8/RPN11
MKVNVSQDVLSSFRRRALRRYPKEYMETVWGQVKGGEAYIYAFHPIKHKSDNESIEYEPVEIEEQRDEEAPLEKMMLLGTIHTHPDSSIEPSQSDWETARVDGDMLLGICQIVMSKGRKSTRVLFYSEPIDELVKGKSGVRDNRNSIRN